MTNKGNLILEYTVLIVIVIAALLGMHTYVTRGLSGRWRQSADVFGFGRQYQPNVTQIR